MQTTGSIGDAAVIGGNVVTGSSSTIGTLPMSPGATATTSLSAERPPDELGCDPTDACHTFGERDVVLLLNWCRRTRTDGAHREPSYRTDDVLT